LAGTAAGEVATRVACAGVLDVGVFDAGVFDAGAFDAGVFDAGVFDAGVFDAGVLDGGVFDAGAGACANADPVASNMVASMVNFLKAISSNVRGTEIGGGSVHSSERRYCYDHTEALSRVGLVTSCIDKRAAPLWSSSDNRVHDDFRSGVFVRLEL